VNKVFEEFHVEKDFSSEHYRIIDRTTRKTCLQFEFVDHESTKKRYRDLPHHPTYKDLTVLHISSLSKCGANSGNMLLRLVDELAKSIPFVEYITLTDASNVKKCGDRLNLPDLRILTSERGESWYNRWGYKSANHHDVMSINSELRNTNMREFLDSNPPLDSVIKVAFPEVDTNVNVHEYVKTIYDQIRSFPEEDECDDAQINKIQTLQMLIGELSVKYSKALFKTVEHGSRGGSKRSAKKRSAKKRITKKRITKRRITKKRRIKTRN
jgi:hypothetical protein